jgi:hypothetical protein
MMKLICNENNLEYTGGGYMQCGRNVKCPKVRNNKILGFDCIIYLDNLPDGCIIPDNKEELIEDIGQEKDSYEKDKTIHGLRIIPAEEQIA